VMPNSQEPAALGTKPEGLEV